MIKMIVACLGDATTRFDRDYYVRRHLPLTMDCWGRYGLEAAEAFFSPVRATRGSRSASIASETEPRRKRLWHRPRPSA